jgi:2-C-methyl-D-erythritol 4-phosphate cytidylyltransferase
MTVQGAGILPTFVTPDSVKSVQTAVAADLENVRAALQKCADTGKFSDKNPEWAAWQNMKTRAAAYIAETPSWFTTKDQVDRGEAMQRELAGWHDKAKALGCDAGPAPAVPAAGIELGPMFAGLTPLLLILALAYFAGSMRK